MKDIALSATLSKKEMQFEVECGDDQNSLIIKIDDLRLHLILNDSEFVELREKMNNSLTEREEYELEMSAQKGLEMIK